MKITKITQQKNHKDRYSIYLDEKFAFGVQEEVLIEYNLHKGQVLSEIEINDIRTAEDKQKIYSKAVNYLSYGMRSYKEITDYLYKQQAESDNGIISKELIDNILRKLTDLGYLNDLVYAESYVRTAANINLKGPKVIAIDLKRKGITDNIIEDALEQYTNEQLLENIQALIEKYIRSNKRLTPKMLNSKLTVYLLNKGYPSDVIKEQISEFDLSESVDNQDELLNKEAEKYLRKYQRKHTGYALKQKIIAALLNRGFVYDAINRWLEANQDDMEQS